MEKHLPFKRIKSEFVMERNDCTVLALSQATPLSYKEAHWLLASAGRLFGRGFHMKAWMQHDANNAIPGIKFTLEYDWYPQKDHVNVCGPTDSTKTLTLGQFIKLKLPGNYLVFVRSHVMAVIDGVIHDSYRQGPRRPIQKIYKVEAV